jgi:recombinational DNA repair ATPase RecF
LLLDDIFSELDQAHRGQILKVVSQQQTIVTTTDLRLVKKDRLSRLEKISLG